MNYAWHLLAMISLYATITMSLNLVAGYTGMLSMCHAAFYGIGAYTSTLLIVDWRWGFVPAVAMAAGIAAVLGWCVAVPTLRLKGDYFVLATLGFQMITYSVLYNCVRVTRGPNGISGIPSPRVFSVEFATPFRFFLLSAAVALGCGALMRVLTVSPFGRALKAIREDELAAAALGKNVPRLKAVAFALSAALAAVPGGLYAGYSQFIDPTSFNLTESIFLLSIVIIGGAGSYYGPLAGTVLLVLLPEALRLLRVPEGVAADLRQIVYGVLLVGLMRFRPRGLLGEYDLS